MRRDLSAVQTSTPDTQSPMDIMTKLGAMSISELAACCTNTEQDPKERARACIVLGLLRCREVVPVLVGLLLDEKVAGAAANGLALLRSRRATRPLLKALVRTNTVQVREMIISALGRLRDRRAEPLLCRILISQDEPETTRVAAACALMLPANRRRVTEALLTALRDPSPSVRWQVINALNRPRNLRVVTALEQCLTDHSIVPTLPGGTTVANAAEEVLGNL